MVKKIRNRSATRSAFPRECRYGTGAFWVKWPLYSVMARGISLFVSSLSCLEKALISYSAWMDDARAMLKICSAVYLFESD